MKHEDDSVRFEAVDVDITQSNLDLLNEGNARTENKSYLENDIGGIDVLLERLGVHQSTGLLLGQVSVLRKKFGENVFPESPTKTFVERLIDALSDFVLIVLIVAACISTGIGVYNDPLEGWVEGFSIFIAVTLVALVTALNDYTKDRQFRDLENSCQRDERASVFRDGFIDQINPKDLVIGDIILLQAGNMIPADCIIIDNSIVTSNESSLTGETDDVKKSRVNDCFLLSSCMIMEGAECRAVVIGIGPRSQWGKIKASLSTEAVNTPLQDKLERLTVLIGKVGTICGFLTFLVLIVYAFINKATSSTPYIHAFIVGITIVVVAIPEGLPLAVAISLAYSTKKMYNDQCFIRVLSACETMGNATNICSDKTGTLTENLMTVVEGYFGDAVISSDEFKSDKCIITDNVKRVIAEHVSVNRTAYSISKDDIGKRYDKPLVIGNKTEGALMDMIKHWGYNIEDIKNGIYDDKIDKIYSFNSIVKYSAAIIHRTDGSVRLFVKGASEHVLNFCSMYMDINGCVMPMTPQMKAKYLEHIKNMSERALRCLLLAHKDYTYASYLPPNWENDPPCQSLLCLDCIVGIIDPLRDDVAKAVQIAKSSGLIIRMVTGDNVLTAKAIAKQCGIMTEEGIAIEGPDFRKLTPAQLDALLPRLQVVARSSPEDKFLLVTRLNGRGIPSNKEEWTAYHKNKEGVTWETHRDLLLPGYTEEWSAARPDGGDIVGVTGDGTNDAPALKAADVGLAMGIAGTKVAHQACDIVILDDRFSSIVRAIVWGRSVYDNVRKFLQFQLTVNITALILVFIGSINHKVDPLSAVQMLWVNLIMDTLGALALATEAPTKDLLHRKPYKRHASLITAPLIRNIVCQVVFQLTLLNWLLFNGATYFNLSDASDACLRYKVEADGALSWDPLTSQLAASSNLDLITCSTFDNVCGTNKDTLCYQSTHHINKIPYTFDGLEDYSSNCLSCIATDYRLGTLIFNTFIFCQIFNEISSRKLFNELNIFGGLFRNTSFLTIIASIVVFQVIFVQAPYVGPFFKTSPLTLKQWGMSVGYAAISLPVGMLMRILPANEGDSFVRVTHIK